MEKKPKFDMNFLKNPLVLQQKINIRRRKGGHGGCACEGRWCFDASAVSVLIAGEERDETKEKKKG